MACKETMDVLNLVEELINDTKVALADGKITIADLPKFLPALVLTKDAVIGAQNIPAEFSSLTSEDIQALVAKLAEIIGVILVAVSDAKK